MKRMTGYRWEFGLIAVVALVSILGFWDIYVGADAGAQPHHHLHLGTAFLWMGLLLVQLILIAGRNFQMHRQLGLAVLLTGPLLVATTAMLSVHSAHKGMVSGEGDFLIIQNVMVTLETALLITLAFLMKARRKLHGALLMSTTILFLGIALFFALIGFVPQFRIEGPETFYRFQTAAMTGQVICLAIGLLFLVRDPKNNWPYLAAALAFLLNEAIRSVLTSQKLIEPLTVFVGSLNQSATFVTSFAVMTVILAATTLPPMRQARVA